MPSYIFHFIVAFITTCLGFIVAEAGEIAVACVFLLSSLALICIGLFELLDEDRR